MSEAQKYLSALRAKLLLEVRVLQEHQVHDDSNRHSKAEVLLVLVRRDGRSHFFENRNRVPQNILARVHHEQSRV
eukprot:CAMPEP_0168351854 /NCGR_PEP_ID=MMETSP0213-20121227/22165_1 /TAXON_ID=151035 /ORGANISM="Euplotes harpa, Strain FSP1.4" /LENGTH=74 /DNA_ID=CAMNT_0008362877 /DNA_START=272 /DNA_END=496 /DNA_ORIENTATION=+